MNKKQQINLIGGGFQHADSSSGYSIPKYVEWIKEGESAPISVYIDNALIGSTPNPNKKNYAWILESSAIIPEVIDWVKNNISRLEEDFELIFTHDERLLSLSPKFKEIITNSVPWVTQPKIYTKSKNLSMIASHKRMCSGHHYRHEILNKYRSYLDHFGWGFGNLPHKEDALRDYRFSIAMENDNYDNIFTEKITDCFVTGTIPVFWGMPSIGKFFNTDGIIILDENFNIDSLTPDLYFSKKEAMEDNFERSLNLPIAEDYMYQNYIK